MTVPRALSIAFAAIVLGRAGAAIAQPAAPPPPPPDADADIEVPAEKSPPPAAKPPVASPAASPPPAPAVAAPSSAEIEALRAEVREARAKDSARIQALEAELAAQKTSRPQADPREAAGFGGATPLASVLGRGAWGISAYVQAQYEQHQDSEDQLGQGGVYLNQDRFSVRRARVRLDAAWRWVELAIMIDGNTTRGPVVGPRRLEASIVYRGKAWDGELPARDAREGDVPIAKLTAGLTEIPFGFELLDAHRSRVFMERSLASLALFPGEQDVGARISGGLGFFRYAIAAMNGNPLDDRNPIPVGDANKAKDILARIGADARPTSALRVSGGVSALYGSGFHAGSDATKDSVSWRDLNQNGAIDAGELSPVPGTAATPSQNFRRWAVGVDLEIRLRTKIGWSTLYGEATAAQNLDRGLFIADPVATGVDVRHFGGYAAFTQEVTPYGIAGFRFDYYDPNADFFERRAGKLIPSTQGIKTFSPVIGVKIPDRARLLFQYDAVRDLLAKDPRGVPVDLKNDRFTFRLQVEL